MEGGSQSRSEEELEKQGTLALGSSSRPQVPAASSGGQTETRSHWARVTGAHRGPSRLLRSPAVVASDPDK